MPWLRFEAAFDWPHRVHGVRRVTAYKPGHVVLVSSEVCAAAQAAEVARGASRVEIVVAKAAAQSVVGAEGSASGLEADPEADRDTQAEVEG